MEPEERLHLLAIFSKLFMWYVWPFLMAVILMGKGWNSEHALVVIITYYLGSIVGWINGKWYPSKEAVKLLTEVTKQHRDVMKELDELMQLVDKRRKLLEVKHAIEDTQTEKDNEGRKTQS
jgi:hypothetical protein